MKLLASDTFTIVYPSLSASPFKLLANFDEVVVGYTFGVPSVFWRVNVPPVPPDIVIVSPF